MPGTAQEASTTSASGPLSNQCSAARSIDAATHWKGIASSSTVLTGSTAVSRSRISVSDCRCVPLRASVVTRRSTVPGDRSVRFAARQSSVRRSTPASVGSAAKNAPLIAPTEVPRITSGPDPALGQGAEHADLVCAENSASAEHERNLADRPIRRTRGQNSACLAVRHGRAPGTQVRRSGRR